VVSPIHWYRSVWRKSRVAAIFLTAITPLSVVALLWYAWGPSDPTVTDPAPVSARIPNQPSKDPSPPKVTAKPKTDLKTAHKQPEESPDPPKPKSEVDEVAEIQNKQWLPAFNEIKKHANAVGLWEIGTGPKPLRGRPLDATSFGPDATQQDLAFDVYRDKEGKVRGVSTQFCHSAYLEMVIHASKSKTQVVESFAIKQAAMLEVVLGEPLKWEHEYIEDEGENERVKTNLGPDVKVRSAFFMQRLFQVEIQRCAWCPEGAPEKPLVTTVIVRDVSW
jgi:hypothetical protein